MFSIDIDVQKRPGVIELGVQGDNIADAAVFDVTAWVEEYGAGTVYIYHQRASDQSPYFKELPIVTADGKSTATWAFDDADTGVVGEGSAQLLYVKDDIIKKTAVYSTVTNKSLGEAGGDTPDPYEDMLGAARAIYQNTVAQQQAATGAAGSASASAVAASQSASDAADAAADAAEAAAQASSVYSQVGNVAFTILPDGGVREVWTKEE